MPAQKALAAGLTFSARIRWHIRYIMTVRKQRKQLEYFDNEKLRHLHSNLIYNSARHAFINDMIGTVL